MSLLQQRGAGAKLGGGPKQELKSIERPSTGEADAELDAAEEAEEQAEAVLNMLVGLMQQAQDEERSTARKQRRGARTTSLLDARNGGICAC